MYVYIYIYTYIIYLYLPKCMSYHEAISGLAITRRAHFLIVCLFDYTAIYVYIYYIYIYTYTYTYMATQTQAVYEVSL